MPEQAEAVVEQLRGFTYPKGAHVTGCELNGKRNTVKPAAALGYDRRIDIGQRGAMAARRGPLHEKLGRGIAERFGRSQAGILGGTIK